MDETEPEIDHRPWGRYKVLEEGDGWKVKRIDVLPGERLSYQKHGQRAEHWMIVAGQARVTVEGEVRELTAGDTVDIPAGAAHRVENPGEAPLTFVEIQRGNYLGEDDIQRIEDDYGR